MDTQVDRGATIARNILPPILATACDVGGWDAVAALVKAFGGKRISIPKHAGDHHPLVVAAGRAVADAICEHFGPDHIFQFPRASHSIRLAAVRRYSDLSDNDLAVKLGCTYRHAHELRKEAGAKNSRPQKGRKERDPRQLDIEDFLHR